tara:strand:- start:809 stop:1303 length:495 start_codon:yes stop_codon:yes gene_type:complete
MLYKLSILNDVSISAIVAYVHYLGIIICFGALTFERIFLKINLSKNEFISIIIADIIYGIAGLAILVTGILRVKYYGQGGEFYTNNPLFWIKVSLYIVVGLISLYPTTTYILWAIPLSKNKLPVISENLVNRFKLIVMTELIGFAIIPFFATLMSRGIGLVQIS